MHRASSERPRASAWWVAALALGLACCGEPPRWIDLRSSAPVAADDSRVEDGRLAADGFWLRSGESVEVVTEVPRGSVLRFATACRVEDGAVPEGGSSVRFGVSLDGESVFESEQSPTTELEPVRHVVTLPATASGRLVFETAGDPARCAFLVPTLGPRDVGTPGSRPWDERRSDIVLFVADTFRADSLTAYGSADGVTPELDAFAADSLVLRSAWAPSTWTLPSTASLLLGVYPGEHGAVERELLPSASVPALAEVLRDAGYRTGAVTESLFVSRKYGLDRGFGWFVENAKGPLSRLLAGAREFLDADDGRPVFLMLHTYHTHTAYRVSDATLAEYGARLGIDADWDEVQERIEADFRERMIVARATEDDEPDKTALLADATLAARDDLRRLYLGAVVDLDRAFGELLDELDRRGSSGNTVVAFTSDHGDAHGEHGYMFHGGTPWDEVLRVPLLLHVPGADGRVSRRPASLVDVAPTLAQLAGATMPSLWRGRSLLDTGAGDPVFAFQCDVDGLPLAVAVQSDLKLVLPADPAAVERGDVHGAYDLAADPRETVDLVPTRRAELADIARGLAAPLRERLVPAGEAGGVELDEELLQLMRELGYVGDGP